MIVQSPILLTGTEIISRTGVISYPANTRVAGFETYHILALHNGSSEYVQVMYPKIKEKIVDLLPKKKLLTLFNFKNHSFDFVFITKREISFKSSTIAKWTDRKTKIEHNNIGISYQFKCRVINPILTIKSLDYTKKALFYKDDLHAILNDFMQLKISGEITKQINQLGVEDTLASTLPICDFLTKEFNHSLFATKGLTLFDLSIKIQMDPTYEESKHNIQLVKYANKALKNQRSPLQEDTIEIDKEEKE
jgi:hypothetical protein